MLLSNNNIPNVFFNTTCNGSHFSPLGIITVIRGHFSPLGFVTATKSDFSPLYLLQLLWVILDYYGL